MINNSKGFTQNYPFGKNSPSWSNVALKIKSGLGFTIVELLVVVAIIAVLSAVVLVNIVSYINKGNNAAIKANLATVLVNAGVYYYSNSNYAGFCATSNFTIPSAAITDAGGTAICNVNTSNTAFCSCASQVGTANTFCVDHTGAKKEIATACAIECPVTSAMCQ